MVADKLELVDYLGGARAPGLQLVSWLRLVGAGNHLKTHADVRKIARLVRTPRYS